MGQNAQSSRSFIKTLWGCTRTLNCYRILGVPGPKCFNPEFGELVFSLTLRDVADAMDAVYAVDAVDAVDAVEDVDAVDDVNVFTRFARFTSSCRISNPNSYNAGCFSLMYLAKPSKIKEAAVKTFHSRKEVCWN